MNKLNIKISEDIDNAIDKGIRKAEIERKKSRYNKLKKVFGGLAAGAIITSGLGMANPVVASKLPLVGGIFETLKDDGEVLKEDYTPYAHKLNKSVTNNGVTVTLDETFCDGETIWTTYKVKSETPFKYWERKGDPNVRDQGYSLFGKGGKKLSFTNEESSVTGMDYNFIAGGKYVYEHTFIGVERHKLTDKNLEKLKNIPDEFEYELNLNKLVSSGANENDKDQVIEGKWNFKVPVKVDKSIRKEINVNDAVGEMGLERIVISPYQIQADYIIKDYKKIDNSKEILAARMKDENGNEIKANIMAGNQINDRLSVIAERNDLTPKKVTFEIVKLTKDDNFKKEEVVYTKEVEIK